MAQHGYLGDNLGSEYDPGYDADDDRRERNHDRDRDQQSRGQDRERWHDDEDRGRRNFMFDDRNRERSSRRDYGDGGRSSSWFSDETSGEQRSASEDWRPSGDRDSISGGEWRGADYGHRYAGEGRHRFSSHPDDHYRSWRDKQMQALDRDYQDYCREREQQFHSDFDAWRSQRSGNQGPLRTGMTQTAQTGDMTGDLELTNRSDPAKDQPDPMSDATSGTTTSEMSPMTKGRRS